MAQQLEAGDRADMERWKLAPGDLPRLKRCLAAYEKRYPKSNRSFEFVDRLNKLKRKRGWRRLARFAAAIMVGVGGLASWDLLAFEGAQTFERAGEAAPPAVARRWSEMLDWHPSLAFFWPAKSREARQKRDEWQVKAAGVQVANGTAPADLDARLGKLKDQAPRLRPQSGRSRQPRRRPGMTNAGKPSRRMPSHSPRSTTPPRRWPPSTHSCTSIRKRLAELTLWRSRSLKDDLAKRRTATERQFVDDLIRSESLPTNSLADQIERAQAFLAEHPSSAVREEVNSRLEMYLKCLDEHDIDDAREFSRKYPTRFATRIERFQNYLKNHETGGRFVSEAMEAKDRILGEWDVYAYRQAFEHAMAHPDDVAEVAQRLRDYLRDHPDGRFAADAERYQEWWDKISVPGQYRVTLRRGEVEPRRQVLRGRSTRPGRGDRSGRRVYGPSTVIRDTHRPVWDYTFPQAITWKLGDPVTVRIIDYDWSASEVYVLNSRQGDPLAIRRCPGRSRRQKVEKRTWFSRRISACRR